MDEFNNFNNKDRTKEAVLTGKSTTLLIIGWVSAVLSLIAYPFIFGIVGVVMGVLSAKSQSRGGLPLIVGSIVLMGIGLIYSGVIMNYIRHYIGM